MNPDASRPRNIGPRYGTGSVKPSLEQLEARDQPSTIFGASLNAAVAQPLNDAASLAVLMQQTQQDILAATTNFNPFAQASLNAAVRNDLLFEGLDQMNLQNDAANYQFQLATFTALGWLDVDDQVDALFNGFNLSNQMAQLSFTHQENFFNALSNGLI